MGQALCSTFCMYYSLLVGALRGELWLNWGLERLRREQGYSVNRFRRQDSDPDVSDPRTCTYWMKQLCRPQDNYRRLIIWGYSFSRSSQAFCFIPTYILALCLQKVWFGRFLLLVAFPVYFCSCLLGSRLFAFWLTANKDCLIDVFLCYVLIGITVFRWTSETLPFCHFPLRYLHRLQILSWRWRWLHQDT